MNDDPSCSNVQCHAELDSEYFARLRENVLLYGRDLISFGIFFVLLEVRVVSI